MKHTEEPWYVDYEAMDGFEIWADGDYNGHLATAWMNTERTDLAMAKANARLIAAAPEMLKALGELVAEFEVKSREFALDHPGTLGLPESAGIIWAKEILKGLE